MSDDNPAQTTAIAPLLPAAANLGLTLAMQHSLSTGHGSNEESGKTVILESSPKIESFVKEYSVYNIITIVYYIILL